MVADKKESCHFNPLQPFTLLIGNIEHVMSRGFGRECKKSKFKILRKEKKNAFFW